MVQRHRPRVAPSASEAVVAPSGGRQPQIQALRAIAVLSVIFYHFWPHSMPGGYAGVDVFFVISGYLMTKSILRIREDSGARLGATMREFYARRLTRILPAALVVLLLCAVMVMATLTLVVWTKNLKDILASALFVENWQLAANSTDYLGSTTGSAVQHFWSLSVEEQFYAVWPLVVFFAAGGSPRLTPRGRTVRLLVCFGALTTLSLVYSIHETDVNASVAYFNTGTRFWELSCGALTFVVGRQMTMNRAAQAIAGWIGLALIAYTLATFNAVTLFPGWRALIPVGGAALVILASSSSAAWSPIRYLAAGPVQWIGDISYSMYLIHWPLLILTTGVFVNGSELSGAAKVLLLLVILGLSWLMKRFVEDRFRRSNAARTRGGHRRLSLAPARVWMRRRRTLMFIVAAQVAVLLVASGGLRHYDQVIARSGQSSQRFLESTTAQAACFAAISEQRASAACPQVIDSTVLAAVPSPLTASQDWPYRSCQHPTSAGMTRCDLLKGSGPVIVAAGDSHTTQWLPAILPWASEHHMTLITFLRSGCPLIQGGYAGPVCEDWNKQVLDQIRDIKPAYVLTSAQSTVSDGSANSSGESLIRGWQAVAALGPKIIAFRDIPQPHFGGAGDLPICVTTKASFKACQFTEADGLSHDLVPSAAEAVPGTSTIDLSEYFCPHSICQPEIDGILLWIDGSHMSSYFSRGLAEALRPKLDRAIRE
ncbi:peptidoglycan/LPS O-acetylase OafA/YrhL [Jatrophihabitans sp. GAS493]|uniref:acyltransferase family protein n=1 Tax=Jatrophihabitans sp. GAS493 TaxID=1907575 RepID=UPI000BB8C7A1|nr:acyltransferase family protein [Jatrophihabitans sp. GAS493]SOD70618.1 peptidoglycan/LPS O-acetylase OafA/YrhL [Jatrophihabitans sp. GAS493]